jgi:hypothetical protein
MAELKRANDRVKSDLSTSTLSEIDTDLEKSMKEDAM